MTDLWHYTCSHTYAAIGETGTLIPLAQRVDPAKLGRLPEFLRHLVWATDLDHPHRDALGLTSQFLACDRTEHRYRVTDDQNIVRWTKVRRAYAREFPAAVEELEGADGAMPAHWWISLAPVPVVHHPRMGRST